MNFATAALVVLVIVGLLCAWIPYLYARRAQVVVLKTNIEGIESVIKRLEAIYAVAGHTRGGIKNAGKEEEHDALWDEGGKYYRKAISAAVFLLIWPIGPRFFKNKMLAAYNKVGLFKGTAGSYHPYEDINRGYAMDTDYYPCEHLRGLAAALRVIPKF